MSSPIVTWVSSLIFGAIIVVYFFWAWFDEPSFDQKTQYFTKYRPRFSTYYPKYTRARYLYVLSSIIIYLSFCLVPEAFITIFKFLNFEGGSAAEPAGPQGAVFPIAVALALVTFQRAPITKDVERRIRASFHAFAKIPEGVRRIVAELGSCELNISPATITQETGNLGLPGNYNISSDRLSNLIQDDEIVKLWYRIGALLDALSPDRRTQYNIDPVFFETYDEEFNSIRTEHAHLAPAVRTHLLEILDDPDSLRPAPIKEADLPKELRELAQRLYTFIACGVQSSVSTDLEAAKTLQALGYSIQLPVHLPRDVLRIIVPIAGLAFVAVMIISVLTAFLTEFFRNKILLPKVGTTWAPAFNLPEDLPGLYLWSWTTAFYYGSAILGALMVREMMISTRRWFELNKPQRERPILRYAVPTLAGAIFGWIALTVVALASGPGLSLRMEGFSAAQDALINTLPWYPLSMAMAFIAVWLVDYVLSEDRYTLVTYRSIVSGLLMGGIGFLTAQVSIGKVVDLYAKQNGLQLTEPVSEAILYVSLFVALLIAIFSGTLCFAVQLGKIQFSKARLLAGKTFKMALSQDDPLIMKFGQDASATIGRRDNQEQFSPVVSGKWVLFPEGTVARWNARSHGDIKIGDVGLISISNQTFVYEGFDNLIQDEPLVVAKLEPLTGN